jgi:hypothetical protein
MKAGNPAFPTALLVEKPKCAVDLPRAGRDAAAAYLVHSLSILLDKPLNRRDALSHYPKNASFRRPGTEQSGALSQSGLCV